MKYEIAFGAYFHGLAVRVVAVKATVLPTDEFVLGEPTRKGAKDPWRETRAHVRGALKSVGIDTGFSISFDHPPPVGSGLDLAIFAACFATRNHQGAKLFFGSLGLQGQVRPARGVLPLLVQHERANDGCDERSFVVPNDCAEEASHADVGTNVFAIAHVSELFDLPAHTVARREYESVDANRFADELGKLPARVVHAIERAAIERKPIHFIGYGGHRSARLLRDLLPPMNRDEAIEAGCMQSIAGYNYQFGIRPFRAPFHTTDAKGFVGGGDPIRPGEVSVAHNGVLFIDNLPEVSRSVVEPLARALRERSVSIVRANARAEFKTQTILVTASTRCPCQPDKPHSPHCAERPDRKVGNAFTEVFYLEWKFRFLDAFGIETIVDLEFGPDDIACKESFSDIRRRVIEASSS